MSNERKFERLYAGTMELTSDGERVDWRRHYVTKPTPLTQSCSICMDKRHRVTLDDESQILQLADIMEWRKTRVRR